MEKLHLMSETLLTYETIDAGQIDAIMEGRQPGPPADWIEDSACRGGGDKPKGGESGSTGPSPVVGGPAPQA
jgi:cell division protease FtsH